MNKVEGKTYYIPTQDEFDMAVDVLEQYLRFLQEEQSYATNTINLINETLREFGGDVNELFTA